MQEIRSSIQKCVQAGIPILVWGPPGVGKSATVAHLARQMGYTMETVIASIREPADFSGLPVLSDDGVRMEPPAWAVRLAQAGRGILFLDEISTAPPAVQAALLRVVLERAVGDVELSSGVAVVAAANPPEWAAGGWELSPPLANRFIHIEWTLEALDWANSFPSYWGEPPQLPDVDSDAWARARAMVAGYIHRRPDHLLQLPDSAAQAGRAWASPRSWDAASRVLAVVLQSGGRPEDATTLIAGAIGKVAIEFVSWAKEYDLPDPREVLSNPDSYPLPNRGDRLHAVLSACVAYAAKHPDLWLPAWRLLARAADSHADVATCASVPLAKARPAGAALPKELEVFTRALRNAGVIQ